MTNARVDERPPAPVSPQARTSAGRLRIAFAMLLALALPSSGALAATHAIALFPSSSNPAWEGFARIVNHSGAAGTVRITGTDDAGVEHGPVELTLDAQATVHFNSGDLEQGNPDKGLDDGLGEGEGEWRLRLESELSFEVLSYIRTGDGFVTAMHQVVQSQGRQHHVRFFNPGSNASQVSRLRLINPHGEDVEVTITGRDDEGESAPGGEVSLTLAAGEAREVSAQVLEAGGDGLVGELGNGKGKWQLFVSSGGDIEVMSLLESPTGHLSNLSAPGLRDVFAGRRELGLPLFLSESDAQREGFARLLNHSEATGTVRIYGIDDQGTWSGPVVLTLTPGAAAHFNSLDLKRGNAQKGLSGALGAGSGHWRLRLFTELDLEAMAYVRTGDGFVTTMHERVRESAQRHHVAFFNPGSNAAQVSLLRLINPGEDAVEVTIAGRDDEGEPAPGGEVSLTFEPGQARMVSAQELESGSDGLTGSLGDGKGKWQLFVGAGAAIEVVNLLRSPTGHLANLSATSQAGVVSKEGIGAPVGFEVVVDIPPEATSVGASALTTAIPGSEIRGAPPGGAPALLVASDGDGAVLYALVNEDGGMLGEPRGIVRVSVASTAVVLAALAAGYRIPSVTPESVAVLLSHAQFGPLTHALARLLGEDKNFLSRLSDYPDVVALVQRVAGPLAGGAAARVRSGHAMADSLSALPNGVLKEDFYCAPLTAWPCSPWHAREPWRWFGNARGAETYHPGGTDELDLTLTVEAYRDFLEEAERPPFLARSEREGSRELHSAANPGFTGYAMELYEGSRLQDWHYVPGNATAQAKLLNSGATYREIVAGAPHVFGPGVDRVRFERYRLTGDQHGNPLPDPAAVVSFLNTVRFVASVANVVTDTSVVQEWLDDLSRFPRLYDRIAGCAGAYSGRLVETRDPNRAVAVQMLEFFRGNAGALFGTLLADAGCSELVLGVGGEGLKTVLQGLAAPVPRDAITAMLTGVEPLSVAYGTEAGAVSYFAPSAARSEYHVQWARAPDGQAYIAQASLRPVPVAEFAYEQQGDFEVQLDGSASAGEGLSYAWTVEGESIGTTRTLHHDFGEAGVFQLALEVTDRHGSTAEERGRVTVTAGRVPEISRLACAPRGGGTTFTMEAEFSDADDDIDTVHWFSTFSGRSPDRETGSEVGRVTLSAPGGASYTRARVRVTDLRGNAAERNCVVEFDPAPPVATVAGVSAEEGETLVFTVTLDRSADEALTLYHATYRASARDEDFDGHSATALDFARGERSKTITVHTSEDDRVEPDETFYVYLAESTSELPSSGLPVRYLARAVGTVLDDDETGKAAPVPRIADTQAEEGEALAFTVTLDRAPSEAMAWYYATYRGTADSDDYTGQFATALHFGPGERTRTITVHTSEDDDAEADETFHVYVAESASDLAASPPARYLARATGTIRDDDDEDVTQTCTGPTVSIPDSRLRESVESALGRRPGFGVPITPDEMQTIGVLRSRGRGVQDLTGLQCATALFSLDLSTNEISDLSSLSGLILLRDLRLNSNRIVDLSPLSGLTALERLEANQNRITDVSALSGLTALERLSLVENRIVDLSPLSELTALQYMALRDNQIVDVSALSEFTALRYLYIHQNRITDVSALSGLTSLWLLYLADNQITDVSALSGLSRLGELSLSNNQITSVLALSGLKELSLLFLDNNRISDIDPLVSNSGLGLGDTVSLRQNPLSTRSRDVHVPALQARGVHVLLR